MKRIYCGLWMKESTIHTPIVIIEELPFLQPKKRQNTNLKSHIILVYIYIYISVNEGKNHVFIIVMYIALVVSLWIVDDCCRTIAAVVVVRFG